MSQGSISLVGWYFRGGCGYKALNFHNICFHFVDSFLVFKDNALNIFLLFGDFDSEGFKITWSNYLLINFADKLLVEEHREETLFMDSMTALKSLHIGF